MHRSISEPMFRLIYWHQRHRLALSYFASWTVRLGGSAATGPRTGDQRQQPGCEVPASRMKPMHVEARNLTRLPRASEVRDQRQK